MKRVVFLAGVLCLLFGIAACERVADIDGERIRNADREPGNWLSHGRTYAEERFSPLTEINADNVDGLGLAWHYDINTLRGVEATPIVDGGIMYATSVWGITFALDARTGEELWRYNPQVNPAKAKDACCDVVNRGPAVWEGKVFVGALDGRLIALDARTGKELWSVQTTDPAKPYTITGAPRIIDDKVIIGNGGAEYGVRGYITAYDTDSGEQLWRFYTVPGQPGSDDSNDGKGMQLALQTWSVEDKFWEAGGGGTVWDSMAYDPDLDLLYIGVGNGSPWNRYARSPSGGDNLFLSSIVALRPDDGNYVWHYQTTPGDAWDYTATQHMILADIEIAGKMRKVLLQAPKNGFFYVLDRETGQLISAEKYAPSTNWALRIDQETGRPVENPQADYRDAPRLVFPAPYGAHNWQPMSYSPNTGLVYIPVMEIPFVYGQKDGYRYHEFNWNLGVDFLNSVQDVPQSVAVEKAVRAQVRGFIQAWDPVTQQEVWRISHGHAWNGGMLSTAGNLLFQGNGEGNFVAYRADTGEQLWSFFSQTGIIAPPITYAVDGEQYITVLAGYGGTFALASGVPIPLKEHHKSGRVLTFKLGAANELPELDAAQEAVVPVPPDNPKISDTRLQSGRLIYHEQCMVCHGPGVVGGGVIADLRRMDAQTHELFADIVLRGIYSGKGMVSFAPILSEQDVEDIHAYIIKRANEDYAFLKSKQ